MTTDDMDTDALPCGRSATAVWDGEGDAHTVECPYCQAVLARRELVGAGSAALLDGAVRTPPGLVDSVMRVVSAERRPSVRLPITGDGSVRTFVDDAALATALRSVLDAERSVVVRRLRAEPDVAGLHVSMTVAVSWAHFESGSDQVVRSLVVRAARELFDLTVASVDLEIVDVVDRPRAVIR